MKSIDDLIARSRTDVAATPSTPLIQVTAADSADAIRARMVTYFGADDSHDAVGLSVDGQVVGYFARTDIFEMIAIGSRAVGAAEHMQLPGEPDLEFLELHCTVAGCPRRSLVMLFDENHPPSCLDHPTARMEPRA